MKIGIITFHWGTNYGAILQAYCLQNYLESLGHDVMIINYQPKQYEFSWLRFVAHPHNWKSLSKQLIVLKKEKYLSSFRKQYLHVSKRYYSVQDFRHDFDGYDVLISGSDQVLNPGFTLHGEKYKPSPAYWLGFGPQSITRIGYAVSFGREIYPQEAIKVASGWVNKFNIIGVREQSGMSILDSLNFEGEKTIVPDPTILLGKSLFSRLNIDSVSKKEDYLCVYMLRREIKLDGNVRYIDEAHQPLNMEQWLRTIINAQGMVTNSYHGAIMSIFAHVPFVVLIETGTGQGMNDRFYTLFKKIGAENRIVSSVEEAYNILKQPVDFTQIDKSLECFKQEGELFLQHNITSIYS